MLLSPEQCEQLSDEIIPQTLREGFALGHDFLSEDQVKAFYREIRRVRPNTWRNRTVCRQSYDAGRPSDHPISPSFRRIAHDVGFLTASRWALEGTPGFMTPTIVSVGEDLARTLRQCEAAQEHASLRNWELRKASLLNYTPLGRYAKPHTDRHVRGMRFAVALGPGLLGVEGEFFETKAGDLEVFIGARVAAAVGVRQPEHGMTPLGSRATVVYDSVTLV